MSHIEAALLMMTTSGLKTLGTDAGRNISISISGNLQSFMLPCKKTLHSGVDVSSVDGEMFMVDKTLGATTSDCKVRND